LYLINAQTLVYFMVYNLLPGIETFLLNDPKLGLN